VVSVATLVTGRFAHCDLITITPDSSKLVHEGDPGKVVFTVKSTYSGTLNSGTLTFTGVSKEGDGFALIHGSDPVGTKDSDEVFASSITLDLCNRINTQVERYV
jgi:hypothetical protein